MREGPRLRKQLLKPFRDVLGAFWVLPFKQSLAQAPKKGECKKKDEKTSAEASTDMKGTGTHVKGTSAQAPTEVPGTGENVKEANAKAQADEKDAWWAYAVAAKVVSSLREDYAAKFGRGRGRRKLSDVEQKEKEDMENKCAEARNEQHAYACK